MADGTHDLSMQSRHGGADQLRHPRHFGISRIGISPAETDEAGVFLPRLRER